MSTATEKLHKVLARAGLGSRREIERWIAAGRVQVDGQVATLGVRVGSSNLIQVDGKPVPLPTHALVRRVLLYHKPVGELCTRDDPAGRPTVFTNLPQVEGRWISIGRLDLNTTGLLLFTNDGDLAEQLMHPSGAMEREYLARVLGQFDDHTLESLQDGRLVDGERLQFQKVEPLGHADGGNRWYRVVLKQGRYREVRRLWQSVGGQVSRLKRIRFGPIELPRSLDPGQWQELAPNEIEHLLASIQTQT